MYKKYLLSMATFILAFAILTISVLHSASTTYVFAIQATPKPVVSQIKVPTINYNLPYPGRILPDSPLWFLKALRDRVWYLLTLNPLKKAELDVLFSDKRLAASKILFDEKKPEVALSTLSKGEKYLESAEEDELKASSQNMNTSAFLLNLANASLKHRQVIEQEILTVSPESARPEVVKTEDYSKNAFKFARDGLNSKGLPIPKDPFNGQ